MGDRRIVVGLDEGFEVVHRNSCALVETMAAEVLYAKSGAIERDGDFQNHATGKSFLPSCADSVLRAAAAVEQTFGGITASLWDDPFEWTLAETLSTPARLIEYLTEVEAMRRRAFGSIATDEALKREIAVPSGEMKTLHALLIETLVRAAHHQGRAFAAARFFSTSDLPRI